MEKAIKHALTFFFILVSTAVLSAQTSQISTSSYNRNSLSFHYAEFFPATSYTKNVYDKIEVPDKYDDNTIADNVIKLNKSAPPFEESILSLIETALKEQKVANKILAKILLDENGVPTIEELAQRGVYNATDRDFLISQSAKEGVSLLQQYGLETMLERVYFMVVTPYSFEKEYNKETEENDYKTAYKASVFHIDLAELLQSGFWELFWWEGFDREKLDYFMNYDFPIRHVHTAQGTERVSEEKKTTGDIQVETLNTIVANTLISVESKEESLKVKTPVFSASPIGAKIGKKEGLKMDHLFRVTEFVQDRSGEVKEKRVGFVRAKNIIDNRRVATGESDMSVFYKAPSKKITRGMNLTEEPEFGLMVGVDAGIGFTADAHTGSYIFLTAEQITRMWKGSRALVSLGVASTFSYSNMFLAAVEFKQDLQLNWFSLAPSAGFGYAYKSEDLKSAGVVLGVKGGINFGKYFQVHAGPRIFWFFDNAALTGIYISAGLRVYGF